MHNDRVSGRNGHDIHILVDVEPMMDSDEALPVWLAHAGAWQLELQARTACTVYLGWLGPNEPAVPSLGDGEFAPRSVGVWSSKDDE